MGTPSSEAPLAHFPPLQPSARTKFSISAWVNGRLIALVLALLVTLLYTGCDCGSGDTTNGFGPDCGEAVTDSLDGEGGGSGSGTLLVSDLANASIRKFTSVSTLNSAVDPSSQPLTGGLTRLTRPGYLSLHPTTNELIVPDSGSSAVLFFESPTELSGDIAPRRVLTGPATELSGPVQVFVDSTTDEMYVLDKANSNVLVFSNASTIDGAVAPTRRLGGVNSTISSPNAFLFRSSSNQLVVINPTTLLTFEDFRTVNGDPLPSGRVEGAATTFGNLTYGEITGNGTLLLVDAAGDQVLSFDGWQFDQTNVAPTRRLVGNNTSLTEPRQFARVGNTLYIADSQNVLVFEDISTLEGNNFPSRKFSGLNPATQTLQGLLFP